MNVLIACCGSSAADKVPMLVEKCVAQDWSVKLLCTSSGEHFFKSFGSERVLKAIGADNVYRDEDEWSFEYDSFDMPVRACHLALRKWADVMVVAPITCNSMAKAVAGLGDNLVSSVLVAWEYHKKSIFFCPACNVDMWKNLPTQRNVALLKKMGVEFLGPRVDRLTNGQVAIGCMEYVDKIVERLAVEEKSLLRSSDWFFRRALQAARTDDDQLWDLIIRAVEEGLIDVNTQYKENGNTLLHLAAGGEESFLDDSKNIWGQPDLGPMLKLINLGADVNIKNHFNFGPLQVAMSCNNAEAVQMLVENGANFDGILIDFPSVSFNVRSVFDDKPDAANMVTEFYFTYGSLKRGFPNHKNHEEHLKDYVGDATTVERFPLVVPFEPSCSNPNCKYLHKQANLCDFPGQGEHVKGEVFRVSVDDIIALDKLEGFKGMTVDDNVYVRTLIDVRLKNAGTIKAFVYMSKSETPMKEVEDGNAEFIDEYLLSMSTGQLKPGFTEDEKSTKDNEDEIKREKGIRGSILLRSTEPFETSSRFSSKRNSKRVSYLSTTVFGNGSKNLSTTSFGNGSILLQSIEPSGTSRRISSLMNLSSKRTLNLSTTAFGNHEAALDKRAIGSIQQVSPFDFRLKYLLHLLNSSLLINLFTPLSTLVDQYM